MKKLLVSGSAGLIGGECVEYFGSKGWQVFGIDNNLRKQFFGEAGDTLWNLNRVAHKVPTYKHHESDIRDAHTIDWLFREVDGPFDAIIHCAAQPSHDKSKEIPLTDFEVNATGTLNLLEATRKYSLDAVFVFLSTNKVYGDAPNEIPLVEQDTRYDYLLKEDYHGVDETCRIDQSTHSIFGASKAAADLLVQEYAHIYGLKTTVFRGGCLTGQGHSGVELHGFLSYLVRCAINDKHYKIYGYKGKQVRDNINSYDVVRAIEEVIQSPRKGAVYNLGGGRVNSISVLEAIAKIEKLVGKKLSYEYVDENRVGDHICYISDMRKFQKDYPNWKITKSLDQTLEEMVHNLYWGKYSDHNETREYPLNENSIVLDVGGYRGEWSQEIVNRYNPHVFIFEPLKEHYDACVRRFKDNPKVKVFNYGLSNRLYNIEVSRKEQSTSEYLPLENEREIIEVRDIASCLPFEKIDLISFNCEGGEYKAIQRLIDTGYINRVQYLQVQFHDLFPTAKEQRDLLRAELSKTHSEKFCYPFVWESWKRN